ncbi:glycosyltransferase [Arthrobacter sp. Hiyo8]|nr:glycosyltransferase [Arthrobacter sp. Hiyo8]
MACIGLRAIALPLGALSAISMAIQHERISMPFALYIGATAVLVSSTALRLLVYRRLVGATLSQTVCGTLAFAALHHVIVVASLAALFGRPAKWERTSKFPAARRRLGALNDTLVEGSLGLTGLVIAAVLFLADSSGLITMFAIALAAQSLMYLASPALALVADRDLSTENAAGSSAEQFKPALQTQSVSV